MSIDYTESFETNLGSWVNDVGNTSNWIRDASGTSSSSTGPPSAYNGSYYIYIETSSGGSYNIGDEDIITYDFGDGVNPYNGSVNFWNHQYGDNQGIIYFEALVEGVWQTLWSRDVNVDSWNNFIINFTNATKIRFRNTRTDSGYRGDVALDYIRVIADLAMPKWWKNISGVWKKNQPHKNISGVWKKTQPWLNVGGVWKKI
jgi:hypothetical protein